MFGGDKCPPNHYAKLFSPFTLSSLTVSSLLNQAQVSNRNHTEHVQSSLRYSGRINRGILILLDYERYLKQ